MLGVESRRVHLVHEGLHNNASQLGLKFLISENGVCLAASHSDLSVADLN